MAEQSDGGMAAPFWRSMLPKAQDRAAIAVIPRDAILADAAALARGLTGADYAAVALAGEDSLWFAATDGFSAISTDRHGSFCTRTIDRGSRFMVADASLDDEYRNARFVVGELRIRFYCGLPLVDGGGEVVGTLCVASRSPSLGLSDGQYGGLEQLAALTMDRLEQLTATVHHEQKARRTGELAAAVLNEALTIGAGTAGLLVGARSHELAIDAATQGVRQLVLLDREMHEALDGAVRGARPAEVPPSIPGQIDLHLAISTALDDDIDRLVGTAAAVRSRATTLERQGQRLVELVDLLVQEAEPLAGRSP